MRYYGADFVSYGIVDQIFPNIFVFDLFTPALCNQLLDKIAAAPQVAPNSMNKYGTDLRGAGLQSWLRQLVKKHVAPLAKSYYPEVKALKDPYGFTVDYRVGKQTALASHIDEPSAVTLNVCLRLGLETDSTLVFTGPRWERYEVAHRVGQAIVHRGHHLHRANAIKSGSRTNLIVWCPGKKS